MLDQNGEETTMRQWPHRSPMWLQGSAMARSSRIASYALSRFVAMRLVSNRGLFIAAENNLLISNCAGSWDGEVEISTLL